eukprot:959510-Prymnesium_polylepis.1
MPYSRRSPGLVMAQATALELLPESHRAHTSRQNGGVTCAHTIREHTRTFQPICVCGSLLFAEP